jgi:hypothetical protein
MHDLGQRRMMEPDHRTGDILRITCPFTDARVTEMPRIHHPYVVIEWPWWSVDPESGMPWNGQVALASDPAAFEWKTEIFRTDPAVQHLTVDSVCRVGIPPTIVHVVSIEHFDPPQETGRLPRPSRYLTVLPAGQSYDPELVAFDVDQGYSIDPDDDIPIVFDLLYRPYAFLAAGDEVADAAGRAWRFDAPWDWQPFDGSEPREPVWPLMLLSRDGRSDHVAGAAVADATRTGSHHEELARWSELAQAAPTHRSREKS